MDQTAPPPTLLSNSGRGSPQVSTTGNLSGRQWRSRTAAQGVRAARPQELRPYDVALQLADQEKVRQATLELSRSQTFSPTAATKQSPLSASTSRPGSGSMRIRLDTSSVGSPSVVGLAERPDETLLSSWSPLEPQKAHFNEQQFIERVTLFFHWVFSFDSTILIY